MLAFIKKSFKFLVMSTIEAARPFTVSKRYRHFRRTLFFVMTTVTLIPLIITVLLSYHQYRVILAEEARNHLRWNAETANKTIKAFVEELRSVIVFISEEYTHEQLADQNTLSELFVRLKNKHRGFVDLGFINQNGIQETYAGPYDFRGKSYRYMKWFEQALARGTVVSEVFLGYRKLPHFVIAISKKVPDKEEYWILRASIDAETLGHFIATIDTEASDDVFLINHQGKLQTTSRYYGAVTEKYPLDILPFKTGITIKKLKKKDISRLLAYTYIEETPWILVLSKIDYLPRKTWSTFQTQLVLIVLISALVSVLVIMRTIYILGNRIREADERREAIMSEVEHTSKLASIGRLAAGVAHEINNPLAIISEKAGLMKDLLDYSENFQHKDNFGNQIEGILSAVYRCKVITHRLLGFARRMDVTPESIIINEIIKEVLSFLDKESLYRGIKFKLDLKEDLPIIQSDRGQLQQILLNIVNNAIDASGKGGVVTISTELTEHDTLKISIADNGPGISPENLKHIFEPFFTTKTEGEHKGTGLGLSITYGLVKKLGGTITVESEKGIGSNFIISMPLKLTLKLEDKSDEAQSTLG